MARSITKSLAAAAALMAAYVLVQFPGQGAYAYSQLQVHTTLASNLVDNMVVEDTGYEPVISRTREIVPALKAPASNVTAEEILQQTVRGRVTDAMNGTPIPGVNVVVQGSQALTGSVVGTVTDVDGNYEIEVPEGLGTLVFSFIGYRTQIVEIEGRSRIDVSLQVDVQLLDDVVVVGYGTQERRQVTGSISSVTADEFITGNVQSAAELIQSKVPGLMISSPGANPNQMPTLRMRGISSLGGSLEPLIVVDGIVGASLENIDPNDIATIDVLKDASAAAIYGTRGAAGVIAITTKRGRAGETTVSYSGSYSLEGVENRLDVLSADEFRELSAITGFEINDLGASTDWFEEITQTGQSQIHNLAVAGGSESTNYRISGNFRDRQGLLITTGNQQLGGRINLNHRTLNDNLLLTFDLSATNREEDRGFNEAFEHAVTFNPTAPVTASGFENTGDYVEIDAFRLFNPVATVKTAESAFDARRMNAALRADYQLNDLLRGLSASAFYATETYSGTWNRFWSRNNKFTGGASPSSLGRGQANRRAEDESTQQFDLTANYFPSLSDRLNMELLAGYSWQDFQFSRTEVQGGGFLSDAVGFNNLDFAQEFSQGLGNIGSFKETNRLIAGFGRVSFDYDHTWFLNASVRREGSSRFGSQNRWGTFWSAGLGVEVTNLVRTGLFDRLRVRGSYGVTGQDAPFNGISQLRFGPTGNFFVGGEFVQRFGPVSNANPDLKWEEAKEFNVGLEFGLLSERLTGILEYYQKTTEDLIWNMPVPVPPNLFPTRWENVGTIENTGIEATLRYDVVRTQNTNWNSGVNFSTNDIQLARFESDVPQFIANVGSPGQNNTQQVRLAEGEPLGQLWGPRFAGIDESGNWTFFNSDGVPVESQEISREDEAIIGNAIPDFEIGWTNDFRHRNWDVSVFFRGVFGHDLINSARVFYEPPSNIGNYNVVQSAFDFADLVSAPVYSSLHVEDATFVRFENLSVGYTVPMGAVSAFQRMRLSLSGRNLFTITGYEGIDPEVRWVDSEGNNPLAPGIERRSEWYTSRSVTLGVQLDF